MEITDLAYMANGQYGIEYNGIYWKKFDTEEGIFKELINIWGLDEHENEARQLEEKGGEAGMVFVKCTQEMEDLPEDLWDTVIMERFNLRDGVVDEILERLDHWEETEVIKTLVWREGKVVEI